jgi:ADP-ribosyl-[dinitrogen reductase] hydrolase
MRHPRDRAGAYNCAREWADVDANDEVKGWMGDAENQVTTPAHPQSGFVKIAFIYTFQHLLSGADYLKALQATLLRGGDTDTNACIVGGLVGAAYGAEAIPEAMRNVVLTCDIDKSAHPRADFLHTSRIPKLVEGLLIDR